MTPSCVMRIFWTLWSRLATWQEKMAPRSNPNVGIEEEVERLPA